MQPRITKKEKRDSKKLLVVVFKIDNKLESSSQKKKSKYQIFNKKPLEN